MKTRFNSLLRKGIEPVGLPGAGKSSFWPQLESFLLEQNELFEIQYPKDPGDPERVKANGWHLLAQTMLSEPALTFRAISADYSGYRRLLSKLAYRLAGLQARPAKHTAYYYDCGCYQPLLTYAVEMSNRGLIEPRGLLNVLPLPKAVVHYKIAVPLALGRYESRQRIEPTREPRTNEEISLCDAMVRGEKVLQQILKYCSQNRVPVLTVDLTQEPSKQETRALAQRILQLRGESS